MKYYKLLNDNNFINIASSSDFIKYSPIAKCFLRSNEHEGEYISLNTGLYRSTWMVPIVELKSYIEATIIEITEEEYNIFAAAIENNETIIIAPEIEPQEESEYPDGSLEFVRESKINEMSVTCRRTIEAGFDLALRGAMHHFSLSTQDQLNLMSLSAMAQTQSLIPYHADGEESEFYTAEEINQIVDTAMSFKNYQIAYYNALKTYINTLDNIENIAAITYGTPIPDEYKSDVLRLLE